jgi:hypothetical protein
LAIVYYLLLIDLYVMLNIYYIFYYNMLTFDYIIFISILNIIFHLSLYLLLNTTLY